MGEELGTTRELRKDPSLSYHILNAGGHWQPGGGSCRGSDLAGVGRSAGFSSWPQATSWAVSACSTDDTQFALLLSRVGEGKPFYSASGPHGSRLPVPLRSPFSSVTYFRSVIRCLLFHIHSVLVSKVQLLHLLSTSLLAFGLSVRMQPLRMKKNSLD